MILYFMSDLRLLKRKYNNAQNTYQFSKSLLNASISSKEIFAQNLKKACEIIEICKLINKKKYSQPEEIVLCGPSEMFSGDFKNIKKEKGDIIFGKKIKGLNYDLKSLPKSLNLYEFKYMNFEKNAVESINFYNTFTSSNEDHCNFHVDDNVDEVIRNQMWKYILATIKYNEQMYRGVAINRFVNNCEKYLNECRGLYYHARNSEITNQIITFRKK